MHDRSDLELGLNNTARPGAAFAALLRRHRAWAAVHLRVLCEQRTSEIADTRTTHMCCPARS
jgi:hypothetical protein